jgi:hypothetical protein
MYEWDIANEKYHKGFPYDNIEKILKKNMSFVINYMDEYIEFNVDKINEVGFWPKITITSIGQNSRTKLHHIILYIFDKNKKIYIANISKMDKIAGKDIIKLAELISKKIGATHVYLNDGASVQCNLSDANNSTDENPYEKTRLSIYMLLKDDISYYEKQGYTLFNENIDIVYSPFMNKSHYNALHLILHKLKRVKLEYIHKRNKLILKELRTCALKNIKYNISNIYGIHKEKSEHASNPYLYYTYFVLYEHLFTYLPKKGNFVKELLNLYSKNCATYNYIIDFFEGSREFGRDNYVCEYIFENATYTIEEIILLRTLVNMFTHYRGYYVKKL